MTEALPASASHSGGELVPIDERLAAMDAAAADYLAASKPANTTRAYRDDWWIWCCYTRWAGIPETSNTTGALVGFVKWLENKPPTPPLPDARRQTWNPDAPPHPQAPATIDRRLTGAIVGLRARGCAATDDAKDAARDALDIYRRRLAEAAVTLGTGQAPPMKIEHLRLISTSCPDTIVGIRDRAIVLLGFRFGARRSEVSNLIVSDIEPHDRGIIVTTRTGKTGGRRVPIPRGRTAITCPVRAWHAWLDASGISDGSAFRQIDRNGHVRASGLSGHSIGGVFTRAGQRAGIPIRFTGHSARAGFATEARRAGHDPKTISSVTGHSPTSRVLHDYFREVDEWNDAPDDIGL